jgi:hypothetical protein
MLTRHFARIAAGLGISVFGVAVAACPAVSGVSTDQSCATTIDSADFPTNSHFGLNKPANCAVVLNDTATLPFAMSITIPSGSVVYNYYNAWVTNRTGGTSSWTTSTAWSGLGTGQYIVQVTGSYYAGHGGWDSSNNGFDTWHHQFSAFGHSPVAHTNLAYRKGTPSVAGVSGPSTGIGSGVGYDITAATFDPLMIEPVNWDFYVDGTYVGSSSDGTYHGTAGSAGTTQTIVANITDANSRTGTGSYNLTVCTGTLITC